MSDDGRDFGFTVERHIHGEFGEKLPEPLWEVSLPHQCDGWRIDAEDAYCPPTEHEVAVAGLKEFIKQAQAALKKLEEGNV